MSDGGEFFMPLIPPTTTHQQKQVKVVNGKPVFFEPEDLKAARSKLLAYLGKYRPKEKLQGPIQLVVKWCYPMVGEHEDGEYKSSKPDLDNAQKLLQDCMTKVGFWKDDSQIVSLVCEKFWAKIPGIYICVRELENEV